MMYQPQTAPVPIRAARGNLLQRQCACGQHISGEEECAECRKRHGEVQRAAIARTDAAAPPIVHAVLAGAGRALDSGTRSFMERRFGHDLSEVRVHTDDRAAESARAIHARAYTSGQSIVFNRGEYAPASASGRWLLAHELTHTIQQSQHAATGAPLRVGPAGGSLETEANATADRICHGAAEGGPIAAMATAPQVARAAAGTIQRLPAPPSGSTYRFCGFGIDSVVPDFVQSHFTGTQTIDYKTGCGWIAGNAWSSLWELYDASDSLVDSNRETPFGTYDITGGNIAAGTPSDGSSSWSLWYQVDRSQPWLTDDADAFPHDYRTFRVYQNPIRNPNTTLAEETGPVVWQDNFTPAEDGASLQYTFNATATRATTDSQTTTASATVSGGQSANIGFEFEGLTAGFSRNLNFSATQSISRTHSVTVSTTQSLNRNFTQPNLRGGVTYSIRMRPLYHLIDGSVDLITHRNGVVSGGGATVTGAIRVLKGMDLSVTDNSGGGGDVEPARRRWTCNASCNLEGSASQCQNQRVTGTGTGSNQDEACRAAKSDANTKVPEGCYKRHCQCDCSQ